MCRWVQIGTLIHTCSWVQVATCNRAHRTWANEINCELNCERNDGGATHTNFNSVYSFQVVEYNETCVINRIFVLFKRISFLLNKIDLHSATHSGTKSRKRAHNLKNDEFEKAVLLSHNWQECNVPIILNLKKTISLPPFSFRCHGVTD